MQVAKSKHTTRPITRIRLDTTEREEAGKELRDSEQRFQTVARVTSDSVWDWDVTTNELWWNETWKARFGYKPEDIEKDIEGLHSRIHPGDRERVLRGLHAKLQNGDSYWADEYRFRRADNS